MRLAYTILYVEDVRSSLDFFEKAFGFKQKSFHESGWGELDTGETTLAFASHFLVKTALPKGYISADSTEKPLGMQVSFMTDDVPAAHKKALVSGAVEIMAPEWKPHGQTVSYVRCPDGCLVEICTPVTV